MSGISGYLWDDDDDIYYGEVSVCKSVCHDFAYFVGKIIWQMGKLFWKVGKIILEGGKIILAGGKIIFFRLEN